MKLISNNLDNCVITNAAERNSDRNDNHLVVQGSTHDGDTSEEINGSTNVGNPHNDTGSNGIRFGFRDPQDTPSRADRMSFKNTMLLDLSKIYRSCQRHFSKIRLGTIL